MSYKVKSIQTFEKQAKKLAKKYPSLKDDLSNLVNSLKTNPQQGKSLGKGCFKIRLSIQSKGKGKSGGARIITHVLVIHEEVYLLSIFDKSQKESLTESELKDLLDTLP